MTNWSVPGRWYPACLSSIYYPPDLSEHAISWHCHLKRIFPALTPLSDSSTYCTGQDILRSNYLVRTVLGRMNCEVITFSQCGGEGKNKQNSIYTIIQSLLRTVYWGRSLGHYMNSRVEWFWKIKSYTFSVVPNFCGTSVPKCPVFMFPLSLVGGPQKIWTVTLKWGEKTFLFNFF